MVDLGYENYNFILNMGSLSILYVAYFLKCFYIELLVIVNKYNNNLYKEHLKSMKKNMFFNAILDLLINGYFEVLISGVLSI